MDIQDSVSKFLNHRRRNALQVACESNNVRLMLAEELKQFCHKNVFRGGFLLTDVNRRYVPRARNFQGAGFCLIAHRQRHSRRKDAMIDRAENCLEV